MIVIADVTKQRIYRVNIIFVDECSPTYSFQCFVKVSSTAAKPAVVTFDLLVNTRGDRCLILIYLRRQHLCISTVSLPMPVLSSKSFPQLNHSINSR